VDGSQPAAYSRSEGDFLMGMLCGGDNLDALRSMASGSVDLVYLDPPFNSNSSYTLDPVRGGGVAFDDVWRWDVDAENALSVAIASGGVVARSLGGLDAMLGRGSALAYLVFMTPRIVELHRVLSPSGSLYLHCDGSASHHLRLLLDAVFGADRFRNEVVWQRQSSHGDARSRFARVADRILFYAKSNATSFRPVRRPLDPDYVEKFYRHVDVDGRRYRLSDMSAPARGGMAAINASTGKPNGWHVWNGYRPPERGWRYSPGTLDRLHSEGRVHCPEDRERRPALKRFLDENEGQLVGDVWDDLPSLSRASGEWEGYPTQKPTALMRRILEASSSPGDVVLDPFCGSGSMLAAAHAAGRSWIGLDASPVAIGIASKRMFRLGAQVVMSSDDESVLVH
jgi:site-specific DNA-methyltransferase (adenine-specific)